MTNSITWEGGAFPLGTTTTVWDNGAIDLSLANTTTTADNALAVTVSPSGAISSGYDQGVYVAMSISGTTTGGNAAQRNAFAADITIAGSHASWIGGAYYYIAASASPTLTSAYVYGVKIDFDSSMTTACDYSANLSLSRSSSKAATSADCFIELELNSSAAVTTSVVNMQGTNRPTYFLTFSHADEGGFFSTKTMVLNSNAAQGALAVRIGASAVWYVPIVKGSNAS